MLGLVVGSYQGCSEALHGLAREAAAKWRQMGVRSVHEALGIYTHDVHCRLGSVFWRSWARVIRGRLPVIRRPNADILHHGPPPAYAHGREAVCWRGRGWLAGAAAVHPMGAPRRRARGTRGGRPVSGSRRAGGYRLSRPCSG